MHYYGGIESGGTKFVCIIANEPHQILSEVKFPTTTPRETLEKVVSFFTSEIKEKQIHLRGIGIGSFGPLDLNPNSPTYGFITTTPKPGWANVDIVGLIFKALHVPISLDTDTNTAALSEKRWGAGKDVEDILYLTIGTGIGGGAVINGKPLHGLVHPEMGHMLIQHDIDKDPFKGCCPFHGDCFEGLASGPSILNRWGKKAEDLPLDHPAWDLEADYIALALENLVCTLSPQKIILGGGVMHQEQLFPLIRTKLKKLLNNYIQSPVILEDIDNYIVQPKLGDQAGVLGALLLALLEDQQEPF
jgi:fructokinase